MSRESKPGLVALGDEIFFTPVGVRDLQCVARTTKGTRCKNWLEGGQIARWAMMRSTSGIVTVYDLSRGDRPTLSRWLAQHCNLHDVPSTTDHEAPCWEPFDPTGRHADQVTSLDAMVEQLTDEVNGGVTADWKRWYVAIGI